MADKPKLSWTEIDLSGLAGTAGKARDSVATKTKAMLDARVDLEKAIVATLDNQGLIPEGMVPVFGYRWGKTSVAFQPVGVVKLPGASKIVL